MYYYAFYLPIGVDCCFGYGKVTYTPVTAYIQRTHTLTVSHTLAHGWMLLLTHFPWRPLRRGALAAAGASSACAAPRFLRLAAGGASASCSAGSRRSRGGTRPAWRSAAPSPTAWTRRRSSSEHWTVKAKRQNDGTRRIEVSRVLSGMNSTNRCVIICFQQ